MNGINLKNINYQQKQEDFHIDSTIPFLFPTNKDDNNDGFHIIAKIVVVIA